MTADEPEQRLGDSGVVRVGDTIRRPAHARSTFVQDLLAQLAAAGFTGAPRPLGFDDRGREVMSFLEGRRPAAAALHAHRRASAQRDLVDQELPRHHGPAAVCHGDLGPHNNVFRDHTAVALKPARRGGGLRPRLLSWMSANGAAIADPG